MQAVIGVPVHAQHLHVPNDGIDGRQKTFAIEAIGVQLLRWLVGGGDDYHAVLEEHLEQPTEDDRVADVADEQLVEAQHANFLRKPFRQRLQRIGRAIELVQPNMYPAHEVVKVLAARRHGNASVEDVHQPGLATADRAPQVDPDGAPSAQRNAWWQASSSCAARCCAGSRTKPPCARACW